MTKKYFDLIINTMTTQAQLKHKKIILTCSSEQRKSDFYVQYIPWLFVNFNLKCKC